MGGELWDVLECNWTRQIVGQLAGESARFNEIERAMDVPTSTLSDRLKRLESAGSSPGRWRTTRRRRFATRSPRRGNGSPR